MNFFFCNNFFTFSFVKAHHKIYSPKVEEGRQSLEWRGHFDIDDRAEKINRIIMFWKQNILGLIFGKVN